jgi:hypothetical protein
VVQDLRMVGSWIRKRLQGLCSGQSDYDWSPAFEMMLEEARRSIDRQMLSVREARQRVGNLLGYAAVIAAALGFTVEGSIGALGWVAVGGFLTVSFAAFVVLYPREFRQDLDVSLVRDWFVAADGVDHMLASAAAAHGANYSHNRRRVRWIHRGISLAVVGLVVETLALLAKLVM